MIVEALIQVAFHREGLKEELLVEFFLCSMAHEHTNAGFVSQRPAC
jgi:hypothetical protein